MELSFKKIALASVISALLSACGGGGGDTSAGADENQITPTQPDGNQGNQGNGDEPAPTPTTKDPFEFKSQPAAAPQTTNTNFIADIPDWSSANSTWEVKSAPSVYFKKDNTVNYYADFYRYEYDSEHSDALNSRLSYIIDLGDSSYFHKWWGFSNTAYYREEYKGAQSNGTVIKLGGSIYYFCDGSSSTGGSILWHDKNGLEISEASVSDIKLYFTNNTNNTEKTYYIGSCPSPFSGSSSGEIKFSSDFSSVTYNGQSIDIDKMFDPDGIDVNGEKIFMRAYKASDSSITFIVIKKEGVDGFMVATYAL